MHVHSATPRAAGAVCCPLLLSSHRCCPSLHFLHPIKPKNRRNSLLIAASNNFHSEFHQVRASNATNGHNSQIKNQKQRGSTDAEENKMKDKFKGSYSKRTAVATSPPVSTFSDNGDNESWEVYPLTTLKDARTTTATTTTAPPAEQEGSWPTAAARKSLYNDIPVERCDGLYLPIRGKLPTWLKGSLYRNGPGHFQGASAVFDGCAMLCRFKIEGSCQRVIVSHRFIETTYLAAARAAGGDVRWTLGHKTGVRRTALERLKYLASLGAGALTHGVHLGDNALISIFPGSETTASGKKELIAHTETLSGTYRIDPDTLETLGRVQDAAPAQAGEGEEKIDGVSGLGKTAHPHVLPNGDVINLACDFMPVASKAAGARLFRPPHMTLYRNPGGDPTRREPIAYIPYLRPASPTWVHQVAVSNNYAVIVQNPCFYGIDNMVFGESGEYLVFKWEPSAGSLIHVVPLNNNNSTKPNLKEISPRLQRIKSFRAPAFLATHWINAFESDTPGGDNIEKITSTSTTHKTSSTTDSTTGSTDTTGSSNGERTNRTAGGRYLNLDACMTKDPRLMAHWSLETVRSGLVGGKQIEVSVMRRLVIDLDAPDGSFLGSRSSGSSGGSGGRGSKGDGGGNKMTDTNVLNDASFLKKLIPDAEHGYAIELPSINNNYLGRQHQFVYAAAARRPANCWNSLTKADVLNGTLKMWHEPGAVCWEPIFVPRPGAVEEDDGVVLSTIMQADGKSALLVLDGQSFKEIARAVVPYGLSNGFHGCFVPED